MKSFSLLLLLGRPYFTHFSGFRSTDSCVTKEGKQQLKEIFVSFSF
jgi:hypothetical protein